MYLYTYLFAFPVEWHNARIGGYCSDSQDESSLGVHSQSGVWQVSVGL